MKEQGGGERKKEEQWIKDRRKEKEKENRNWEKIEIGNYKIDRNLKKKEILENEKRKV